jgi:hypothetical protein
MSSFDGVDEFLMGTYQRHLEDVLCDGCLVGRLSTALGAATRPLNGRGGWRSGQRL